MTYRNLIKNKIQHVFSVLFDSCSIKRQLTDTSSERTRSKLASYMTDEPCVDCNGQKLNRAVSMVTVGNITLPELSSCSVLESLATVQRWRSDIIDPVWSELDR